MMGFVHRFCKFMGDKRLQLGRVSWKIPSLILLTQTYLPTPRQSHLNLKMKSNPYSQCVVKLAEVNAF